jgi:hypothetical protein
MIAVGFGVLLFVLSWVHMNHRSTTDSNLRGRYLLGMATILIGGAALVPSFIAAMRDSFAQGRVV